MMDSKGQAENSPELPVLRIRAESELPEYKLAVDLDDMDRDILEMHQKDVFFSYVEMAEKWGVTAATIRNRIKRMKAAGVMDVVLVLNPYKIGYNTFSVIGLKIRSGADAEQVASALLSIPGVTNLVMVAGRFDFFVDYMCKNMDEYREFMTKTLWRIPNIANAESFLALDLYEPRFKVGVIR